jgi:hypothetical protein
MSDKEKSLEAADRVNGKLINMMKEIYGIVSGDLDDAEVRLRVLEFIELDPMMREFLDVGQ